MVRRSSSSLIRPNLAALTQSKSKRLPVNSRRTHKKDFYKNVVWSKKDKAWDKKREDQVREGSEER